MKSGMMQGSLRRALRCLRRLAAYYALVDALAWAQRDHGGKWIQLYTDSHGMPCR